MFDKKRNPWHVRFRTKDSDQNKEEIIRRLQSHQSSTRYIPFGKQERVLPVSEDSEPSVNYKKVYMTKRGESMLHRNNIECDNNSQVWIFESVTEIYEVSHTTQRPYRGNPSPQKTLLETRLNCHRIFNVAVWNRHGTDCSFVQTYWMPFK